MNMKKMKMKMKLYIPHGSDESYKNYKYFHNLFSLYIPHGSDERGLWMIKSACGVALYPTWFR